MAAGLSNSRDCVGFAGRARLCNMTTNPPRPKISRGALAKILGIKPASLAESTSRNAVPPVQRERTISTRNGYTIPGQVFFYEDDVLPWLDQRIANCPLQRTIEQRTRWIEHITKKEN